MPVTLFLQSKITALLVRWSQDDEHALDRVILVYTRLWRMPGMADDSNEEIREALGVFANTVIRDWDYARAWLTRDMRGQGDLNEGSASKDR